MISDRSGPAGVRLTLQLVVRLAIGVGLLGAAIALAIPDDSGAGLGEQLVGPWLRDPSSSLLALGLAASLLGVGLAIGALRFQLLLRGAGIELAWTSLLHAYIVACFFNLVVPGAILGDVYRAVDARRAAGSGGSVLGMVVLERLLSLSALGTAVALILPALPSVEGLPLHGALIVGSVLAVALAPWLPLFARSNALLLRIPGAFERMSPRLATALRNALVALGHVTRKPGVVVRGFALSLVLQWLPVAAVLALSLPLETGVGWTWFAVIVPFVTLVSLLPISLGGAGVRELLFVSLFGAVGMDPMLALGLSLGIFAVALFWGAVGLLLFTLDGRSGRRIAEA